MTWPVDSGSSDNDRLSSCLYAVAIALLSACRTAPEALPAAPAPAPAPIAAAPGCALAPTRDSVVVSIVASVRAADSTLPIPRDYARALVFEIGRRLTIPPTVLVDTYEPARLSMSQDRETGFMSLSAVVELRLRRGAPPDQVAFLASSLSPELDGALQAAIERLVADRLGALPDSLRAPRMAHVSIDTRLYPDSLQTVLFEMSTPLVEFDSLARFGPGSPRPTPPPHLRRSKAGGQVKVRFVVNAEGRMVGSSLRILEADDPVFADAVAAALLFTRFHPATVGGCRVASVLELLYQFATY